ncbi:hypothetical protein EXU85_27275 [Spirosoma sp. KCTC 42546]|uniref:hypothetical protein n=1 Tax=Spirosoma sp. KCTC 42546 TaxID=2520506 RepID=UPI00115B8751|nr:hypothetical protein [Spirosoma sp. KCTC 42546]QDK82108.1 hypothetical protein EXU85_27275 [Spirosoma sp. KCTC 42546]
MFNFTDSRFHQLHYNKKNNKDAFWEHAPTQFVQLGIRVVSICIFGLLCLFCSVTQAQSLQWSTAISNKSSNQGAIQKIGPGGSIYVLTEGRNNASGYSVADIKEFGPPLSGPGDGYNAVLSKYSPDGNTLEWVRIFNGENSSFTPLAFEFSPSGELVLLCVTNGGAPASALITPNGFQTSRPNTAGGNLAVLMKLSPDGKTITYGTYLGAVGGSSNVRVRLWNEAPYFQNLIVTADGSMILMLQNSGSGVLPTTPGAYQSAPKGGDDDPYMAIFNADGTLRYASYYSTSASVPVQYATDITPDSDGSFYATYRNGNGAILPITPGAAYSNVSLTNQVGYIAHYGASGQLLQSTALPGTQIQGIRKRPNGNLVVMGVITTPSEFVTVGSSPNRAWTPGQLTLTEFNPTLTSVIRSVVVGNGSVEASDMELDAQGRVHISGKANAASSVSPTPGALYSIFGAGNAMYQVIDCDFDKVLYATYLNTGENGSTTGAYDVELKGCRATILATAGSHTLYPVTPTGLADNGTSSLSGYNLVANPQATTVYLTAFTYAKYVDNTNTIAATITSYCEGAGLFPITGSKPTYTTPFVRGGFDANPAPVSLYYQWQSSASAAGPWTNIPGANSKDYTPASLSGGGSTFFRRAVQLTPFDASCSPVAGCDVTNYSNSIEYTVSANKAHSTDLASKPYGFCNESTLTVTAAITTGADGDQGAYVYTLGLLAGGAPVLSGTVATAAMPISLTTTEQGNFLLSVTDSRGCTSYDTLKTVYFGVSLPSRTVFTCGNPTVKLGPVSLPQAYANVSTNTYSWTPTLGLDNPNGVNPTVSTLPPAGASQDYYLDFNGCRVDTVTVMNQSITPLPALPSLTLCQGDTVRLGQGLTEQAGVSYGWVPGLGIGEPTAIRPVFTATYAPQGVNTIAFTVIASNGTSGCVQTATQQVTVYKTPNNAFNQKQPYVFCPTSGFLATASFGTPSETGISYSWQAVITSVSATQGVPSPAQAITFLSSTTAAQVSMHMPGTTIPNGGLADGPYTILYIRTSQNATNPACARVDTAEIRYIVGCGVGGTDFCRLDQQGGSQGQCGGSTNTIGPISAASNGTYTWSPVTGLSDPATGLPLVAGVPHPARVIANPSGLVAVTYTLSLTLPGIPDTCQILVKVFPGQSSLPVANYSSPVAACKGGTVQIQQNEIPGYRYNWTAGTLVSDSTIANPTTVALLTDKTLYVKVTDEATGCSVQDTVKIQVTPVDNNAGLDGTYCLTSGGSFTVGSAAKAGYTYAWSSPTPGVVFGSPASATSTVSIPPNTDSPVLFIRNATNGNTAANCSYADTVQYTSFTSPALNIHAPGSLCAGGGGSITIGPVPDPNLTYLWSTGETTAQISVSATGPYNLTVGQGSCSATATINVNTATDPTVNLGNNPIDPPCNGPVTIGVNNSPDGGWSYSWSPFTGVVSSSDNLSTLQVYPDVPTSYTLTATHATGCVKQFVFPVPPAAYVASLPASLNFCEGDGASTALPLNNPPAGSTVVWTASPSSATAYLSSTSVSQPILDITAAVAGTYTYIATVTYGSGCVSVASVNVKIGKQHTNLAGDDKAICLGSCVQIGKPVQAGISYSWSTIPYDATKVAQISNLSSSQPSVCPTSSTVYKLTYFDANAGCSFGNEMTVQVTPQSPVLTVNDLNTTCQTFDGTATFDLANAIVGTTGASVGYYADAAATIPVANPVSLPTTYYIKSISADGFCSTIKPVSVSFTAYANFVSVATSPVCSTNGTGVLVKGSVTLSNYTAGSFYQYVEGTDFSAGTKMPATPTLLGTSSQVIISGLDDAVLPKTFTVRVFNPAAPDCYAEQQVTVQPSNCCIKPSFQANAVPVSCLGNVPQANGQLVLSGFAPGNTYQFSAGNTFTEAASLSGPAQAIPANGVIVSNLTNPVTTQDYTVRVFSSSGCYTDVTVQLTATTCACPPSVCIPIVIRKIK